jgi:hypothetical protein
MSPCKPLHLHRFGRISHKDPGLLQSVWRQKNTRRIGEATVGIETFFEKSFEILRTLKGDGVDCLVTDIQKPAFGISLSDFPGITDALQWPVSPVGSNYSSNRIVICGVSLV